MDTAQAVEIIANAFAGAEANAKQTKHLFRNTKEAWEALREGGVIGGLEMQAHYRKLDAMATAFEAELFDLHALLTAKANEKGIDLPSPRGGGGR